MSRFSEIPRRLVARATPFQIIYMMVFSIYATVANLYIGPFPRLTGYIYLALSLGSVFILLPLFRRVLFLHSDPLRTRRLTGRSFALFGWRLYLYLFVPAFFVILLQIMSGLIGAFIHFDQTNVSDNPSVGDYITPFLAGTEEIWRWSMIGTIFVVGRRVLASMWTNESVRKLVFAVALFVSSVSFGAGHILEFQSNRLAALILFSSLGALLAFMTIVTGRIVLVVCVHVCYDLWVTLMSSLQNNSFLIGICIYGALLLAPLATLIFRRYLFAPVPVFTEIVCLTRYQTGWQATFLEEQKQLQRVFHRRKVCEIHHIGSTAVAGMIADDVIDIQIGVTSVRLTSRERLLLEHLGYEVCGSLGVRGRILLSKKGHQRFHIHLVEAYGPLAHANITLLTHLREHQSVAEMYGQIKCDIAEHKIIDYAEYQARKAKFVEQLVVDAYKN